eukprot:TRINITY_DN1384_c0_g1_i2.p1 TRINITY_DN1384_c0_g1~~TRINITY_DN1384_c0_g1_i2.p1  ORF type:complete len:381 (+),score=102.93 TRINITY_DN1384_c0_g1_i2:50-1144(+)
MKPNVLVLGATGFIGRNLVRYLMDNQFANCIRCVDKVFPQTAFLSQAHAEVYNYTNVCQFMQGNLTSAASIAKCFDLPGGKFNFVFNCAAETKYGQDESIYQEKTLQLAVKVAQEAAKRGADKFVHLSNAQVYEEGKKASKEESKCAPWTALAAVQLKTEEELKKIAGLNLVILRPSMVYGPGDTAGIAPRVICAAVYKKLDEKMKFMWGGDLKINTVHVLDVVAAMWHAAMNLPAGSLFNLSDKNDTDQEKLNKVLEDIFHISTGFVGSIMSNLAKVNFKGVTEEVNDKHMKPWSELCREAGIANTPLTPYLDPELLYNNSLSVDGSAIEKTGFVYKHPNLTKDLVLEQIMYFAQQNLFPFKA